jgi:hypothetical protein
MTRYNLTDQQEELLSTLVRLTFEGKLKDPIVPIPIKNGKSNRLEYVLHLRETDSFRFTNISDLDALCDADLLSFRWNRSGIGKLYSLTKAAAEAVKSSFEQPFSPPGPRYRPNLIVKAMNGYLDATQSGPYLPDIDQIAADPLLLHTTVEELITSLLGVTRSELRGPALLEYNRTARELKEALFHGRLSSKEVQEYARKLAGLEEETSLMLKAWPYIYPLLLLAEKRKW